MKVNPTNLGEIRMSIMVSLRVVNGARDGHPSARRRARAIPLALALVFLSCSGPRLWPDDATGDPRSPRWLLPVPEVDADPAVPELEKVLGYAWGEDISSHAQIETYLRALAEAAPRNTRWTRYGETYEGRGLYLLAISSPANTERLEEIRGENLLLADPRSIAEDRARELLARAPAIVWLSYTVHGNESSGSDAALLTAYHLLADRRPETRALLEEVVVIIDPLQNPDGRDRFISSYREARGVFPQADPWATERTERWPRGRFNHYLFDLNRDWFLQSQIETRARVRAYLRWHPHIFIDAHEMGPDSTYFFAPPAEPVNDRILPRQEEWFLRIGRHQAERFDAYGFAYTTREMFDSFYPGYGETWPTLQGAVGILWEQAGVRGLVVTRRDELELRYHDAVRHHYISGLATIEVAARSRRQLVEDFHLGRKASIQMGAEGEVRHYFLLEGRAPQRARQLARTLLRSGIEVRRLTMRTSIMAKDPGGARAREHGVPAGAYHVPLAQPAGRLARTLLDRHTDMGEDFTRRQLERKDRRVSDQIYDVTAWSLPLAFAVEALAAEGTVEVESERFEDPLADDVRAMGPEAGGRVTGASARLAYLVSGDADGVLRALSDWLQAGLRVRVADEPFKLGGTSFPRGSLILRVHENPPSLSERIHEAATSHGLTIHGTDSAFVEDGAHLGGPYVEWVEPPRVLLAMDQPLSPFAGHTWYLFDHQLRYPTTRVAMSYLDQVDLPEYNVLILPDGAYSSGAAPGEGVIERLRDWVRQGGTLIAVKGAAAWAASDDVKLLASDLVKRSVSQGGAPTAPGTADQRPEPETEPPDSVPGAFLRATVYAEHWVTFGIASPLSVFFEGNLIFSPLSPAKGRNLVTFAPPDELLVSGFCWPRTLELMGGKPYVLYQPLGSGHIVAFADDPNYRAMYPELQRLFFNAVMFGPGH